MYVYLYFRNIYRLVIFDLILDFKFYLSETLLKSKDVIAVVNTCCSNVVTVATSISHFSYKEALSYITYNYAAGG